MDSSQYTYSAQDELKYIQFEARRTRSLDDLRLYFERVQNLRRSHTDDFDLQVSIAEIQEQIIDRARVLREESAPILAGEALSGTPDRAPSLSRSEEFPPPSEVPPAVHRMDAKSWQRSIYLALFLTFIMLRRSVLRDSGGPEIELPFGERQPNNAIECEREERAHPTRRQCATRAVDQAHLTPIYRSRARHRIDRRQRAARSEGR